MATHPWLQVPLQDYEGHMRSPQVAQLDVLTDLFDHALHLTRPKSLAVLGVAGGNGLDRIDRSLTRRVVGIDVNPEYLEAVRRRFPVVELHCSDLSRELLLSLEPVDLVHAALIFEHAGTGSCLTNAVSLAAHHMSVILQLPSKSAPAVGRSGFTSLAGLADHFSFVDPDYLARRLDDEFAMRLTFETRRELPGGKAFWMGIFESHAKMKG